MSSSLPEALDTISKDEENVVLFTSVDQIINRNCTLQTIGLQKTMRSPSYFVYAKDFILARYIDKE